MNHTKKIERYEGALPDLARDIASLPYERVIVFLQALSASFHDDAVVEGRAGKQKVANALSDLSTHLSYASQSAKQAWKLS